MIYIYTYIYVYNMCMGQYVLQINHQGTAHVSPRFHLPILSTYCLPTPNYPCAQLQGKLGLPLGKQTLKGRSPLVNPAIHENAGCKQDRNKQGGSQLSCQGWTMSLIFYCFPFGGFSVTKCDNSDLVSPSSIPSPSNAMQTCCRRPHLSPQRHYTSQVRRCATIRALRWYYMTDCAWCSGISIPIRR